MQRRSLLICCPVQVGVRVSGGCEEAVQAARRFVDRKEQVFTKLDFAHFCYCLHRDHMFETVGNLIPEIYSFCFSAYRHHSILQFGHFFLMSRVGRQEGNPLAGLLF